MYGFAQDALVIFPKYEFLEKADYRVAANLKIAATKICSYLRSRGIAPNAFITDDIARSYSDLKFKWVSTLAPGDLYFMSRECDMASNIMMLEMKTYPDVYENTESKYPYPQGADVETRFKLMCDRDKKAAKAIIPQFKVVVNFYQRGAINYSVASKPGDGRIRLVVDVKSFMCKPYMGGNEEEAIDLLGANFASRSVLHWEV